MVYVVLEITRFVCDEGEQRCEFGRRGDAVLRHGADEVGRCLICRCAFGREGSAAAGVGCWCYLEELGGSRCACCSICEMGEGGRGESRCANGAREDQYLRDSVDHFGSV